MATSTHTTLNGALVAALGEMPRITKGNTAKLGNYSYKYADLADVIDAVRPVLARHGLAVVQDVHTPSRDVVEVTTIVLHETDEREYGPLVMTGQGGPQALGSAITYARRYALLAALGIATEDDDDDAVSASPARGTQRAFAPARPPSEFPSEKATDRQLQAIAIMAGKLDMSDWRRKEFVIESIGRPIASSRQLTPIEAAKVIGEMQSLLDAKAGGEDVSSQTAGDEPEGGDDEG